MIRSLALLAAATPAGGGGVPTPSFGDLTYVSGTGSVNLVKPTGADATTQIAAVVQNGTGGTSAVLAAMPTPAGWTELPPGPNAATIFPNYRAFIAPGNVSDVTFACASGSTHVYAVGFTGTLAATPVSANYGFTPPTDVSNAPSPSITIPGGMTAMVIGVYLQNTTSAISGSPTSGYSRALLYQTAAPYRSVVTRTGVGPGATGDIQHGAGAQYDARMTLTIALQEP